MPPTAEEIIVRLDTEVDQDGNVLNMATALEIVTTLEDLPMTKEDLEIIARRRIGKKLNDMRRKMKGENDDLAKRAKNLMKKLQGLLAAHFSNTSATNSPRANTPVSRSGTPTTNRSGTPTANGLLRKNELLDRAKSCTPEPGQPHGNGQHSGKKRKQPSSESSPPPPKISSSSLPSSKNVPRSPSLVNKKAPSSPSLNKKGQGNGLIKSSKKGSGGRRSSKSASPLTITETVESAGKVSPLTVTEEAVDSCFDRIPSVDVDRVESGASIDSGFCTESSPPTSINGFLKSPQPTADVYLPSDTRIQEDRIVGDSPTRITTFPIEIRADQPLVDNKIPGGSIIQTDTNQFLDREISEPCLPPSDIPQEDLAVCRKDLPSDILAPESEADGINGTYNEEGVWTDWSANVTQRKGELLILPYVILE